MRPPHRRSRRAFPSLLLSLAALPLLLALAGCEPRVPMTRGQAAAIADNRCLADGLPWGEPSEILAPGEPDAQGRSWWQVRYPGPASAAPRILLVDDATGWARQPPDGYAIRIRPAPATAAAGTPLAVREGSQVLVLAEPAQRNDEETTALEREAVRLNGLAGADGLPPLFQVRTDAHRRTSLLYGWQADHGIVADDALRAWVVRQGHPAPRWVDLLTAGEGDPSTLPAAIGGPPVAAPGPVSTSAPPVAAGSSTPADGLPPDPAKPVPR